jgi:hypothetical protein
MAPCPQAFVTQIFYRTVNLNGVVSSQLHDSLLVRYNGIKCLWRRTRTCALCKLWGFHGGDYEECRLLGYKTPVRTSQETHYFSATQSSQLMLCKIWGFHGGDYEECRLLGYKNPVRTSQETHCFSGTESSRLMLCKILGSHSCDYEECRLLGYKTQFVLHRKHITSPLQSPAN